jgi:hypothetical protein
MLLMALIAWFDSVHHNPDHITAYGKNYAIHERGDSNGKDFIIMDEKTDTVYVLSGTVDFFGDGPELYWWDIDSDGENELYVESPPRNQCVKFYPGKPPVYYLLSDTGAPPGTQSWIFREMRSSGFISGDFIREQFMLACGIMAGIITLIIFLLTRFFKRRKIRQV